MDEEQKKLLEEEKILLMTQARLSEIIFATHAPEKALSGNCGALSFFLPVVAQPLSEEERARLQAEIEKITVALERSENKLKNP